MFQTTDELEADLLDVGLSAKGARLLAGAAKPAVTLTTAAVESEIDIPLGETKIGGCPDGPGGFEWPRRPPYPDGQEREADYLKSIEILLESSRVTDATRERGRLEALKATAAANSDVPLTFIAQINLATVAAAGVLDPDFPRAGRLLLFYDLEEQPWGFQPSDAVGTRLIYDASPAAALTRQAVPLEIAAAQLDPLRCTLTPSLVPPPWDSPEAASLDEGDLDALVDWNDNHPGSPHRVGGYPTQIQGDMAQECVLVSRGFNTGRKLPKGALQGIDVARERQDWVFLFQIGSDDNNSMMWGDTGMLYLWIHRSDLKARRFENARLILRCG